MAEQHFSVEDVVNMYKNMKVDLSFVLLTNLNMLPLSFTENRFLCNHEMLLFDIADVLKEIYDVDEANERVDITSSEFEAAVSRLNSCLTDENIAAIQKLGRMKLNEDSIAVGIGTHLIQKLSGNALTSEIKHRLQCPCGCRAQLDTGNMYIGTESTWHGELDILSGNKTEERVAVVTSRNVLKTVPLDTDISADESVEGGDYRDSGNSRAALSPPSVSSSLPAGNEDVIEGGDRAADRGYVNDIEDYSQGDSVNSVVKHELANRSAGVVHLFSEAIVFGWTEYNRHRNFSPFIPSVYIDGQRFLIVIYNPCSDSLISSKHVIPFIYQNAPGQGKYAGIFALWLVLNYRLFFRKQVSIEEVPCGFRNQMQIDRYERLNTYQKNIKAQWRGMRISHEAEYPCLKVTFQRGLKRRRSVTE